MGRGVDSQGQILNGIGVQLIISAAKGLKSRDIYVEEVVRKSLLVSKVRLYVLVLYFLYSLALWN